MQGKPIKTDGSEPFARHTMLERNVKIAQDVIENNPLPTKSQRRISSLIDSIKSNTKISLSENANLDYEHWLNIFDKHKEESWLDGQWFFLEHLFYRHLVDAVRWWEFNRDPFLYKKQAELESKSTINAIELVLNLTKDENDQEQLLSLLIDFCLWGNRIDLSYEISRSYGFEKIHTNDVIIDERDKIIPLMLRESANVIHIVTDNSGIELAMDLILSQVLIKIFKKSIILHTKYHPTFVSDVTPSDIFSLLEITSEKGIKQVNLFSNDVMEYLNNESIRIVSDLFWNSGLFFEYMPYRLKTMFSKASLVIFKGDLNYRGLCYDTQWSSNDTFQNITRFFPAPLVALRTLKSPSIVGIPQTLKRSISIEDKDWNVNGRRGLIQTNIAKR